MPFTSRSSSPTEVFITILKDIQVVGFSNIPLEKEIISDYLFAIPPEDRATLGSDPSAGRMTEVWGPHFRVRPAICGPAAIVPLPYFGPQCAKPRGFGGRAPKSDQQPCLFMTRSTPKPGYGSRSFDGAAGGCKTESRRPGCRPDLSRFGNLSGKPPRILRFATAVRS